MAAQVVTCSAGYFQLYGLKHEQGRLPYQRWVDLVHPDDRRRVRKDMLSALVDARPLELEFRAIWPDGTVHWISRRSKQISDDRDGRRARVIGICVDVTEKKQLEQEFVRIAENERLRLSSELHDSLRQQLSALRLLALVLQSKLDDLHSPQAAAARQLVEQISATSEQVRKMAEGLMPVDFDAGGLMKALQRLGQRVSESNGIDCAFVCKEPVLIVDDHPLMRQAVRQVIEQDPRLSVCGEAYDVESALKLAAKLHPRLAIVDISLRQDSGLILIRKLLEMDDSMRILVLSMHDEALYAERSMRAGAHGYVCKYSDPKTMLAAIGRVLSGSVYLSPRALDEVVGISLRRCGAEPASLLSALSNRELQVLGMIGRGMSTRHIAQSLLLSSKTIDAFRYRIKKNLDFKSSSELVRFAMEWTIKV